MIPELVDAVLRSVQGSSVTELEYHAHGYRVRVVREFGEKATVEVQTRVVPPEVPEASGAPASPAAVDIVRASMHGTFFRGSSSDQPPLVAVGQRVEAGQQLGFIEAMKMLHAIDAESAGRVTEVLAENGSPVEPGTPLFAIQQDSASDV